MSQGILETTTNKYQFHETFLLSASKIFKMVDWGQLEDETQVDIVFSTEQFSVYSSKDSQCVSKYHLFLLCEKEDNLQY